MTECKKIEYEPPKESPKLRRQRLIEFKERPTPSAHMRDMRKIYELEIELCRRRSKAIDEREKQNE